MCCFFNIKQICLIRQKTEASALLSILIWRTFKIFGAFCLTSACSFAIFKGFWLEVSKVTALFGVSFPLCRSRSLFLYHQSKRKWSWALIRVKNGRPVDGRSWHNSGAICQLSLCCRIFFYSVCWRLVFLHQLWSSFLKSNKTNF